MRVAFGATALLGPLTGIGQYALHLAAGLAVHPEIDLTYFYGRGFARDMVGQTSLLPGKLRVAIRKCVPQAYALRRLLEQTRFAAGVRRRAFDLYHEPNYLALRFDGPTVVTVHDLSWLRFPETHPGERVRAMERYFEPALRRASVVLTDSAFVKQEVLEVFGGDPQRIHSVPLGLDPVFRPQTEQETRATLAPLKLSHGNYFLCVGTLEPRKNLQAALAAYSLLPDVIRQRFPLVLAGMKGWATSSLDRLLAPLVRRGEALVLGYLDRQALAALMAGAATMVYPSLYEGFGLPPLEAMGCGVPPIISTAAALVEVVGDGGLVVDPGDFEALSRAMERMVTEPGLRSSLATRSLGRAELFTWGRCVEGTLQAYRAAVASPR